MKNEVLSGPTSDTCYLVLTRGQCALVDRTDLELLAQYRWCTAKDSTGRLDAVTMLRNDSGEGPRQKMLRMSRLLLDAPRGMMVRHLDGDALNNTRRNLAVGSNRKNQQERHTHLAGALPGVAQRGRQWVARVQHEGSRRSFSRRTEAAAFCAYWQECLDRGFDLPDLRPVHVEKLIAAANRRVKIVRPPVARGRGKR